MIYKKYLIRTSDQFDPMQFPQLMDDLDTIQAEMKKRPDPSNPDILLSFLKHHSIDSSWEKKNPEMTALISSKALPVAGLEALFESCDKNPNYGKQLEEYIRTTLKQS